MENKKPVKKIKKFREIMSYLVFGFLLGIDILVGYFLYQSRAEYFNFVVDFTRSIELGFFVLKILLLVGILIINLKALKNVIKQWHKETYVQKVETREGEKEIKRIGFIRKLLFFWRVNGARKWMDKYHESFKSVQKMIGRVRGTETKELRKLKEELIKGILIWTEDFKITRINYDKKGKEIFTNIPVTANFLNDLYLEDLYEIYAVKGLDTASMFIDGVSPFEKEEVI